MARRPANTSRLAFRSRRPFSIPTLDYSSSITVASAQYDKIQVLYEQLGIESNATSLTQLDQTIDAAAAQSNHFRGNSRELVSRTNARSPNVGGTPRKTLLAGTKINFATYNFPSRPVSANIRLALNPTRYCAHHVIEANLCGGHLPPHSPLCTELLCLPDLDRRLKAGTLNAQSNVIPPVSNHDGLYRADAACLSEKLELAQRIVISDVANGREINVVANWQNWCAQHVEVYWEFECENALFEVEDFARRFSLVDNRTIEQCGPSIADRSENQVFYRIMLGYGNTLLVYAKRLDRIRFEIKRTTSLWSMISGCTNEPEFVQIGTSKPLGNDGLMRCIEAYADWAAGLLNNIFRSVAVTQDRMPPSMWAIRELVRAIDAAAQRIAGEDATRVAETIWLLFSNGGFIETTVNPELHDTLTILASEGYVVFIHRAGRGHRKRMARFYLESPYRESLGFLNQCADEGLEELSGENNND